MAILCVLLSAAVLFSFTEANSGIESLYGQFLENLRSRNVNYIAPGEYDAAYNNVSLDLHLIDILKVDEEEGYIKIITWLQEEFTDPRLKWNPEEFGGVDKVNVPRQHIWIPDWEVFNPLAALEYFGDYKAVVNSDGHVFRIPVVKIKARCLSEANDTITCSFKLGSWIYNDKVVSPILTSQTINLDDYRANFQWSITDRRATRRDLRYACCAEIYPSIDYQITLVKNRRCSR